MKLCPECNQPMLRKGQRRRHREDYRHASGCPLDRPKRPKRRISDKERLDWLQNHRADIRRIEGFVDDDGAQHVIGPSRRWRVIPGTSRGIFFGGSLRAAIDAAIRAERRAKRRKERA